jgi:tRNA(Ile)-lysidine synthase
VPSAGGARDVKTVVGRFLASLTRPGTLLVAVSGGSDSMALLHLLKHTLDQQPREGVILRAATVDHGLRVASAGEARQVQGWCRALGIDHETLRWEGGKPKSGLQAAARDARYRLLGEAATRHEALAILTGHTLDDQIETVAMRSARARQPKAPGLSGMAGAVFYGRRHWILRPLLGSSREELRHWLVENSIAWLEDPSNDDDAFERVRLRQERKGADKDRRAHESVEAGRERTARAGALADFIGARAGLEQDAIFVLEAAGADRTLLLQATSALATLAGGGHYLPDADATARLDQFLLADDRKRITVGRALIEKARGRLYLCREWRSLPSLQVEAGAAGCWDRRFFIRNGRLSAVTIAAADREDPAFLEACESVPGAVRRAAMRSRPSASGWRSQEQIAIERRIGLYDTFLPVFDLTLANAIARLVGRAAYVEPPVHPV